MSDALRKKGMELMGDSGFIAEIEIEIELNDEAYGQSPAIPFDDVHKLDVAREALE